MHFKKCGGQKHKGGRMVKSQMQSTRRVRVAAFICEFRDYGVMITTQ